MMKMIKKQQILKPVSSEFESFMNGFKQVLHSEVPLLQSAIETVLQSNGKHLRPLLLLLTAKACGNPTATTQEAAIIIELLHTTTLIHDDVVDETKQRRGKPSLNAIFDNRIAVLTGDYLLAGTMLRAAGTEQIPIIKIIARICRELSEGELMQLDNARRHLLDEEQYLRTIHKKTASLISACAEIGAFSVNAPGEIREKCRLFGEYLGYCFQIKDDIFDYQENTDIGKPTGNDIREGKITLPLLYALQTSPEKGRHMNLIKKQDLSAENITSLIAFAKEEGGIAYAESRLAEYKQKAVEIIQTLPESKARESLLLLADFFSERNH